MPTVRTIIATTDLPLTLEQFKAHTRVENDQNADDAFFQIAISGVYDFIEKETYGHALRKDTWKSTFSSFSNIVLPKAPIHGVSQLQYVDASGQTQTLPNDQYYIDTTGTDVKIKLLVDAPFTYEYADFPVSVTYIAGYSAANFPPMAKVLLLKLVTAWFDERDGLTLASLRSADHSVKSIISLLSRPRIQIA